MISEKMLYIKKYMKLKCVEMKVNVSTTQYCLCIRKIEVDLAK